jgi:hypothetical protein
MAHLEIIPHHSSGDAASAHAIANIAMESEGESRPSRIHLPYRNVHKFCNDGLEAGKFPQDAVEDVAGGRLQEAT